MLVLKDRFMNAPIMSLQTGGKIAEISGSIIDPRQLKIIAFYCSGPRLDMHPAVLHVDDIREVSRLGLIVDDAESIMSPDGLVRLQDVIDFHFKIEQKTVVDDQGRKIGKVINYAVDNESFYIVKLHVRPPFMQSLLTSELLIDRSQIREITDKQIVVKAPLIKDDVQKVGAIAPNPFIHPQAETTTLEEPKDSAGA